MCHGNVMHVFRPGSFGLFQTGPKLLYELPVPSLDIPLGLWAVNDRGPSFDAHDIANRVSQITAELRPIIAGERLWTAQVCHIIFQGTSEADCRFVPHFVAGDMLREHVHKDTNVPPAIGGWQGDEVTTNMLKHRAWVHGLKLSPWLGIGFRIAVTLRALLDHPLAVCVDARPRNMSMKSIDHSLVTGVTSEFASMGVGENLWHQLRWDYGLEDGQSSGSVNHFSVQDVVNDDKPLEVLLVEGFWEIGWWGFS